MGWHKKAKTKAERSQYLKYMYFLVWLQLSNFSIIVERLGTFPLDKCQCLFGASHSSWSLFSGKWWWQPDWGGSLCGVALIGCHASISLLQTRGLSSLIIGGDSLIGSVGHSELDYLWASSIYLKGTFFKWAVVLEMELPLSLLTTTLMPFLYCTHSGSAS